MALNINNKELVPPNGKMFPNEGRPLGSGNGGQMSAVDILDALPAAKNDPELAKTLISQISKNYGSEDMFFMAAAKQLKVSPNDIKNVLIAVSKLPQDNNQDEIRDNQLPQLTDDAESSGQMDQNVSAQGSQQMTPQQMPQQKPPAPMNAQMQPPPQLNGPAVNQASSQMQQGGMAPAQAQNQAAQQPQAQQFNKGGMVHAPQKLAHGGLPNAALSGTMGMDKPSFFKKIEAALSQTRAGKQILESDLTHPSVAPEPKPQHKPDSLNDDLKTQQGYDKVIQNNPNAEKPGFLDRNPMESGDDDGQTDTPSSVGYNEGGFVQNMYQPNQQGPSGYADGGSVEGVDDSDGRSPPTDNVNGNDFDKGGASELPATAPEEKADDIPAKLSENEFVIPAFAVKYWGLAHLHGMIAEAESEMSKLEDEGKVSDDTEPTKQGIDNDEESPQEEAQESPEEENSEDEGDEEGKKAGGLMKKPPQKLKKGGASLGYKKGGMVSETNKENGNAETIGNGNRYSKGGEVKKHSPQKLAKGGFLKEGGTTPAASLPEKPFKSADIAKLTRAPRQTRTFHIPKPGAGAIKPFGTAAYGKERIPNLFTK